ncbi:IS110 family transposase [Sulfurimonas sp. NWX367]|uniref:IS110 family transposase n=1 Tax=unclassified Sulfurimonas TaxID=2623549 RepID=UPI00320482D4
MENIYIGCDVSKSKIDYCILSSDKDKNSSFYGQFKNSLDGYEKFLKTIAINYPFKNPLIGFESTGAYTSQFQKYLSDNGILHKMFNAKKVSKYLKSMDIQGKTDKSDSYGIAHFCAHQDLKVFSSSYSVNKEKYTQFTTSLRLLMKIRVQINNSIKSLKNGNENFFLIEQLEKSKIDIKNREKNIKEDAISSLKIDYPICDFLVNKYSGLGYSLLLLLVPKIYDNIEDFNVNQTVAFLGLNPVSFQSGQMKYADKLNIFGDKELKRLLYMASLTSVQFNPILKKKYERYVANGKTKKHALTIISRKLISLIVKDIKKYKAQNK